jgi:DNA-binding transcriptional MerR regulator
MAHEIAKLILEHAGTVAERSEAVRAAGMPLSEIQEYLDWLENVRRGAGSAPMDGTSRTDAES